MLTGGTVLSDYIKGVRFAKIPKVLDAMITNRELVRQTLASDYESTVRPYRESIKGIMDYERTTALTAMGRLTKQMELIRREQGGFGSVSAQMMVMAAGLDLAEQEVGWFETDADDDNIGTVGHMG